MSFRELHRQASPLVLCNVWDVASAKIAERLGFQAIGTSSAAIASMLGYRDGEAMCFSELSYVVERIKSATEVPLTVDLESGYSREPEQVAEYIKRLFDMGVCGINIEDSIVGKERCLVKEKDFSDTLIAIKSYLGLPYKDLFINVRTDAFLLGYPDALNETKKRIRLYEAAGADGVFIPCLELSDDIKVISDMTDLPINVLCTPNLPDFKTLGALGVARISMGNVLFDCLRQNLSAMLKSIIDHQSFKIVF